MTRRFVMYGEANVDTPPEVTRLQLMRFGYNNVRLCVVDTAGNMLPGGSLLHLNSKTGLLHLHINIEPAMGFALDADGRLVIKEE